MIRSINLNIGNPENIARNTKELTKEANNLIEKLFYNQTGPSSDDKKAVQQNKEAEEENTEQLDMQFCTEGSTSDNLDNFIIGKRIG